MEQLFSAINLSPIFLVCFYLAGLAVTLFIGYLLLIFLGRVFSAPFRFFSDRRRGAYIDEFDSIVVFWGGVAIVVVLVIAAFHFNLVAFE